MGFLSSIFGGKTKKQRPTQQERALATQAAARDQRFQQAFMPLEMQAIEQYFDPSAKRFQESVLRARVNADSARSEAEANRASLRAAAQSGSTLSSGSNAAPLVDTSIRAAEAKGLGDVEAAALAQDVRDREGIGLVRTGNDVSRSTSNALAQQARQANFAAGSRLRSRMVESQARQEALGQVLSSTITAGAQLYNNAMDPTIPDASLRGPERWMRSRAGLARDPQTVGLQGPPAPEGSSGGGFYDLRSLDL